MNHRKLIIIVSLVVILITTYLVLQLATPCNGSYEFSLREGKFTCNQASVPDTKDQPDREEKNDGKEVP